MDWMHKHFGGVQTYPQSPDQVLAQARGFVADELRWKVSDAVGGFEARGASFGHAAVASFQVASAAEGARVTVELVVERAGYMGFMLFDVGGYYNGQIAHWLAGIGDRLEGRVGATAPPRPPSAGGRLMSWMIAIGAVGFGIWGIWNLIISPLIGLATGVLDLTGRGGDLTLHGAWARGVSAAILAVDAFLAFLVWRRLRRNHPQAVRPN